MRVRRVCYLTSSTGMTFRMVQSQGAAEPVRVRPVCSFYAVRELE